MTFSLFRQAEAKKFLSLEFPGSTYSTKEFVVGNSNGIGPVRDHGHGQTVIRTETETVADIVSSPVVADTQPIDESGDGFSLVQQIWTKDVSFLEIGRGILDQKRVILAQRSRLKTLIAPTKALWPRGELDVVDI